MITDFEIDEKSVADTRAIIVLSEMQEVLCSWDKLDDFEIVENIISVFEKYNIDCGNCHDFC